jgi:hypothetical protein
MDATAHHACMHQMELIVGADTAEVSPSMARNNDLSAVNLYFPSTISLLIPHLSCP